MNIRLLLFIAAVLAGAAPHVGDADRERVLKLKNGFRLCLVQRRAAPLVAVELWVRAGAREEGEKEQGAAHFLEHTLFKGTTHRAAGEADFAVESLGATLSASTGPDYARFYTRVGAANVGKVAEILADIVRNPLLPAPEIERERHVILDELAKRESDPTSVLIDRIYAAVGSPAYRRPPAGSAGEIRDRTRGDLVSFYRRMYRPDRCTLVLVGDLSDDTAAEIAERCFGDWQGGKEPAEDKDPGDSVGSDGGLRLIQEADIDRPMVAVAFTAPRAADAQAALCAQMTAAILGASAGGRLGIAPLAAASAVARYTPRRDASLLTLTAAVIVGKGGNSLAAAEETERALTAALSDLRANPITRSETEAARAALQWRSLLDTETLAGVAEAIGRAQVTGGDAPSAWQERLGAVDAAALRQFVSDRLDIRRRIVLILLPRRS